MIKIKEFSSEHKLIPNNLLLSSEKSDRNRREFWDYHNDDLTPYKEYSYSAYCTYAWIITDEINFSDDEENTEFPIAVMDYKPSYSKRTQFVFSEPIWEFIEDERTNEQQKFIDKNLDKLNELWIECAQSQGYLENVKI